MDQDASRREIAAGTHFAGRIPGPTKEIRMFSRTKTSLIAVAIVALSAGSAALLHHPVAIAAAALADSAGNTVATAAMWQEASGLVHVDVEALALPPGDHGIHFHAVGTCNPTPMPLFSSAGGHFNP